MKILTMLLAVVVLCAPRAWAEEEYDGDNVYSETQPPEVWIFTGLPGGPDRSEIYANVTRRLATTLTSRYNVLDTDVTILFGDGTQPGWGACDKESMAREFSEIVKATRDGAPVWIFLIGHSTETRRGVEFNIPGTDVTARELDAWLSAADPQHPISIFVTTALAGKYIRALGKPNRIVVSATNDSEEANETEFPGLLVVSLDSGESDANGDGWLSVDELFIDVKRRVEGQYEEDGLILTEHCELDGNGDGRPTRRPSSRDINGARRMALKVENAGQIAPVPDDPDNKPDDFVPLPDIGVD